MFGVGTALELAGDPGEHLRADIGGPAFEALGRPLFLGPVALGHVGRTGGKAVAVPAGMGGDAALTDVEFNQGVGSVQFEPLADQVVRHGVVVLAVLDMVINMHGDRLDMHVLVGVRGQGLQRGFIQGLEGRPARTGPALEGAVVEVIEQRGDMTVERLEGEEPVVAQAG